MPAVICREYSRAAREEARVARLRQSGNTGAMHASLDHLPVGKQAELAWVVEVLASTFAGECATRQAPGLREGRVVKIILFGSYARGDWVEDPLGRYFSDYDLLVIVADEAHTDVLEFWETAEQRLLDELATGTHLRTPVSFIVHSLADVNDQLARSRYFFTDIAREGVLLLDTPDAPLVVLELLAPATALSEARGHYADWIPGAATALKGAAFFTSEHDYPEAAFLLHQAAERLYNGLLLVVTLYIPRSHNLRRLHQLAERIDPGLAEVWPADSKFPKRCFELLRAAYVKARYSPRFTVTPDELGWMRERILVLQERVTALCEAHLTGLR